MSYGDWEYTTEAGLIHRYVCEWCGESMWRRHYEEETGSWLDEHEDMTCENCGREVVSAEDYERPKTFWNGEKATCRPVHVRVLAGGHPNPWYAPHVGEVLSAVEVRRLVRHELYGGQSVHTFYIDNDGGQGWQKVTSGHGSPAYGHRSFGLVEVVRGA